MAGVVGMKIEFEQRVMRHKSASVGHDTTTRLRHVSAVVATHKEINGGVILRVREENAGQERHLRHNVFLPVSIGKLEEVALLGGPLDLCRSGREEFITDYRKSLVSPTCYD